MHVTRPSDVTEELSSLWGHAHKRLLSHRGGPELYDTIRRDVADDALLAHVIATGSLWTIGDEDGLLGFALVRDEVVECLFVDHQRRREHVATTLLNELVAGECPPEGRLRFAGGPRNEVVVRVLRLEGPSPYDARRVGGRRVVGRRAILVGGGGGGTFMPSNLANSGMAPAL